MCAVCVHCVCVCVCARVCARSRMRVRACVCVCAINVVTQRIARAQKLVYTLLYACVTCDGCLIKFVLRGNGEYTPY